MMLPTLEINNLVATFRLSTGAFTAVAYRQLAERASKAEWNPRRFHAIILRALGNSNSNSSSNEIVGREVKKKKRRRGGARHSSAIVYKSGSCVLTGAGKSLHDACSLASIVCAIVNVALRGGEKAHPLGVCVVNMVANVQLPFRISAERAVQGHSRAESADDSGFNYTFDYDPTMFPALKCRMAAMEEEEDKTQKRRQLSILAFNNGKLILTGLTSLSQLERYYAAFAALLKRKKIAYGDNEDANDTVTNT